MSTTSHPNTPVAPGAPMPHRKIIRSWVIPISQRSTAIALALSVLDFCLFGASLAAVIWVPWLLAKIALGVVNGFIIGRLFILGHDACHQAFTPSRKLNTWLGRLLFMPSLTPYSLWAVGHNVVHHGYTNLKGFDFVWQPRSLEEFRALPRWRQRLERIYRSGFGPGLYYMIDMWWKRMYFLEEADAHPSRRIHVGWRTGDHRGRPVGRRPGLGRASHRAIVLDPAGDRLCDSPAVLEGHDRLRGVCHHTHTSVAWYEDKVTWAAAQPFVSTTVHLTFGRYWGSLVHHIMEHTAHHVDMSVPLYRLKQAQKKLETMLPGRIVIQRFSGAGTSIPPAAASSTTSSACAGPTIAVAPPAPRCPCRT
jgi:omega-6 fatty acid desaturase (delta-12 desaturase)